MFTPLHYFTQKLNPEVKEVYWQTLIANLALSLVFIFEPIYLYTLGYSLIQILWFYVGVYVLYSLLIGFAAKITSKIGYKHSILISDIIYVVYWIVLYLIRFYPVLIFAALIFFALQKSFFWPAFDADVAISDKKNQRGREVGVLFSLIEGTFIISPLIGGFISAQWGFFVLFITASILMVSSAWPLFQTRDVYDRHEFKFKDVWKIFQKYPLNFFGYWGYAEDLMIMSLWPIFIFIIVPKVAAVGILTAIAMLIATMLMLYIGSRTDRDNKRELVQKASWFYALTWLARGFAVNLPLVIVFDVLTKLGKGLLNVPMVALTFEIAGSKDPDFAIAYSVFYEFSLAIGKIVTALGAIAILYFTDSIYLVFGFVGVLTLFYGLLKPFSNRK